MSSFLVRTRRDFLMVEDSYFGCSISPYTVDYLDKDKIAGLLATAGRDYIKQGFITLCPDFSGIFERFGSSNTKNENKNLLNLLRLNVSNMDEFINMDELVSVKADEIYKECAALEENIKECKWLNPCWECGLDAVYIREKEDKLEQLASVDAELWVYGAVEKTRMDLLQIVNKLLPFYEKGPSESVRKQEQRNRDLFFVMILQGLCYFYDFYTPIFSFSKYHYSIVDILAIRAALANFTSGRYLPSSIRYPLSVVGFYDCLEAFHKRIEEFSNLNLKCIKGLEWWAETMY